MSGCVAGMADNLRGGVHELDSDVRRHAQHAWLWRQAELRLVWHISYREMLVIAAR